MAMSILSLPQELLFLILEYVGAPFFRDDIGRITICKRWSYVALSVFWADVKISNMGIKRLMRSPDSVRQLDLFKHHIKSLDIDVLKYGYEMPDGSLNANDEIVYTFQDEDDSSAVAAAIIEGRTPLNSVEWEGRLENDLARLLDYAREGSSLRSLRLITPARCDITNSKRHLAVHRPILLSVFSFNRITFLELDTYDTWFRADGGFHICPLIPALFSHLRCLHLRMRVICPHILQPKDDDDNGSPISLERVVLVLVRSVRVSTIWLVGGSVPCSPYDREDYDLGAEMEKEARQLVTRMADPKVFKIVSPGDAPERYSLYSLDLLSNQRVGMEEDEWGVHISWD